ncbi:nucleosome assembly protein 1-like 1 [Elephas maximus indicus]|uniref:nucleosome assembly protein 1-like 1 n=1 Tax=Elephas maximus indicus TaxID=99487 RepID=UPI0021166EA1|nr:nucleosome assembly protein 1-like 1 [Elephas maximus indicus]
MPYDEMGGCAPEEADAGSGRQHPQALVVSIEAAGSLGGRAQGLPRVVKRRINALKNLQAEYAQIEAQFYRDLYGLETKYAAFYQPLFDKRSDIINAIYEPTEDECQWEVGIQKGVCEATESEPEGKPPVNGIPRFWLTAFKNIKILRKLIQENDELILAHLKDVKIKFSGVEEPMSFTIEFVFMSTEYFFNKVLTKTYHMRSHPDDSDPFFSQGPEIISSSGCKIYWKQGKNVTMKTLNLQQCAGHGSVVPTRSKVPSRSFFTYFYPPDSPQGRLLGVAVDYKLAYIFRELLIPKPVLFFTKEAIECNSDEEGHEAGGEEGKKGDKNEEPEGGPKKNLILVEDSTGESRYLPMALNINLFYF